VPGRFELPREPRARDGWFRLGIFDVTTTTAVVGLSVLSMLLYAINQEWVIRLFLFGSEVKQGELWRLFTWPVMNPPTSILVVLTLLFFWFVGHQIEERVGRKRFTVFLLAVTALPAALMSVLAPVTTYDYGLYTLGTALLAVLALMEPNLRFIFGIPAWVLALVYGVIDVLKLTGDRLWGSLGVLLLATALAILSMRSMGFLEESPWVPKFFAPARQRSPKRAKRPAVVSGPWAGSSTVSAAQGELDELLDKISATGMSSLSKAEKERLNELSKRLRGT
jgi:membrane associated rhomboid family serine protease